MIIRHTTDNDLERVMGIYAIAREFMAEHDNPNQWGRINWPPEELIRDDIRNLNSYVCEADGRVVGVFYYNYGHDIDPMYRKIYDGEWLNHEPYGVVHRIAGDGTVKGIGTFCINWAFEQCKHLRIDTHGDNYVMQNLLTKLGFQRRGIIYVQEDSDPRIAFEKMESAE